MKEIKFITLTILVAIIGFSCDGEDAIHKSFEDGIAPNFQKDASTDAFFDLNKIQAGENVNVTFNTAVAQGTPISSDIIGFYKTASGSIYKTTLFEDVTLPSDFTISANDIVSAFSELSSINDVGLGDVLTISASFTRPDGTVLNVLNDDATDNFSANIRNSALFDVFINYPVSCPSDLAGTYDVLSSGFSTDGGPVNNPIVDFPYTVTVTDNGGGAYTISDGVAGIYIEWYSIYGYTFETQGNFTEICGNLSGSWIESFGCTVELTGIVNEDGTLTIQWSNCFGDTIEEAIYTPKG